MDGKCDKGYTLLGAQQCERVYGSGFNNALSEAGQHAPSLRLEWASQSLSKQLKQTARYVAV